MAIDLVMQWCVYNDYPIFRKHMKDYRGMVNKIIIYPSRHHGHIDLENFVKKVFPETWVKPVAIDYGVEDWRQAETMPCLSHLESDWVWFSEQDFFVKDWNKFFFNVEKLLKSCDMFGWENPSQFPYIHPCCLFIKRELLEKTNKDFRAHPEIIGCDHFAMLTRDAEKLGAKIIKLQDYGYKDALREEDGNAMHLGGLTYPYQNWPDKTFGVGNLEAFFTYNRLSRIAEVRQSEEYGRLSTEIEKYLKGQGLNLGYKWEAFFG